MSSLAGYRDNGVIESWLYFSSTLSGVVLALAALRVYVARSVVRRWSKDDTFMLLALSIAFVCGIVQALGAKFAKDVMTGRQQIGNVLYYGKLHGMVGIPTYALATALAKCAIVFYLVRLAVSREIRVVAYAAIVLTVAQCLAVSVGAVACSASLNDMASLVFSQSNPEGYPACAGASVVWVTTAYINSFTDLILLVLPLWILQPLRARWEKKLAITGVLMGGGFVFGVSIYRAYQALGLSRQGDIYNQWTMTTLWCIIELLFGLICACLPAAKALYNHIRNPDRSGRSGHSLRTVRLRTLTQPATTGFPSDIAHGGGGVVRLGSLDGTTAAYTEAYTASAATAIDTITTTTTSTTITTTKIAKHSPWHCSDVALTPPGRARVLAENGCSACGGECGGCEASCLGSARLSLSITVEEESALQHDAMWDGESANEPRPFAVTPNQTISETRW
ncbi:hypothetical protein MAPG_09862 [Magnaporthiopsis poae ATCC 64411]|uniref:Rhodopsin domain-containing protein n=1 Tax=Magnaporthiopsis poae (strain ATCC 64411 / 73-15) TaxID=644358 RepID=A0A0C4EB20_MAGP6|nr:hypothetical protein MAPG_09862 [Magnaporthiopsis poae ATCC 64411]